MNAVCPGTVETPSWHVSFYDDDDDDDEEEEEDSNYAGDGADADDFKNDYSSAHCHRAG